jgi:hypothetical protein
MYYIYGVWPGGRLAHDLECRRFLMRKLEGNTENSFAPAPDVKLIF